jgi:hypothetical protein
MQQMAKLDNAGDLTGLRIQSGGDAITQRWMELALPARSGLIDLPDATAAEGLFVLPYGIAAQHLAHGVMQMSVPVEFRPR